jgi:5-methyltetrahydropteroyltriglutamate--homocysteine methyltransferase
VAFPKYYGDALETNGMIGYTEPETVGPYEPRSLQAVCVGPVVYDDTRVRQDIANLQAALVDSGAEDAFLAVGAPGSIQPLILNEHYPDDDAYLEALAHALHHEYKAITDAGLLVQIDDAMVPYMYDMNADWDVGQFRAWADKAVAAVNLALEGIPEEQVRYHICWGSWNGPHSGDIPLPEFVDLLLKVNAGAYSLEGANARHAWEWEVWKDVKLPEGKVLIPGVVEHCTNVIEHPETVAQRITRYAEVVGRENVIAGTDCGYRDRIHPELAWAKQQVMAEGAALASSRLW